MTDLDFTRTACLNYLGANDESTEFAAERLKEDPAIGRRDIFHAACAGDVQAVADFLEKDPALFSQRGGSFEWEPLLYACYSRIYLSGYSTLEVANLLLEHGADPDAHYLWGEQYRFTALCGIFAEGEQGPGRFPEHQECEAFARLLLEAGADPNDGQALYNRMFTPGSLCLELMLEYGLNRKHSCNWLIHGENGELVANPDQTLRYQLHYAIKAGYVERAKLCVEHGADLTTNEGETPVYEAAMLSGEPELAALLVAHGAEESELSTTAKFASACMAADRTQAKTMISEDPDLLQRACKAHPDLMSRAAETQRADALRLMVELGADLSEPGPLFIAVWHGHLDIVQLLVELGADINARDKTHNATPLQWAEHHGDREAIREFLLTCGVQESGEEST